MEQHYQDRNNQHIHPITTQDNTEPVKLSTYRSGFLIKYNAPQALRAADQTALLPGRLSGRLRKRRANHHSDLHKHNTK